MKFSLGDAIKALKPGPKTGPNLRRDVMLNSRHTIGGTMTFSLGGAIKALKPGPIFRRAVMLYADRKLFLLATFHVVMTAVVIGETDLSFPVLSDHLKNMIKEFVVRSHCACVSVKSLR
jgi:hypothetical protein